MCYEYAKQVHFHLIFILFIVLNREGRCVGEDRILKHLCYSGSLCVWGNISVCVFLPPCTAYIPWSGIRGAAGILCQLSVLSSLAHH